MTLTLTAAQIFSLNRMVPTSSQSENSKLSSSLSSKISFLYCYVTIPEDRQIKQIQKYLFKFKFLYLSFGYFSVSILFVFYIHWNIGCIHRSIGGHPAIMDSAIRTAEDE